MGITVKTCRICKYSACLESTGFTCCINTASDFYRQEVRGFECCPDFEEYTPGAVKEEEVVVEDTLSELAENKRYEEGHNGE